MMNWKGCGRKRAKPNRGTVPGFCLEVLRKNTRVCQNSVPAEVPAKRLQNAGQEHYRSVTCTTEEALLNNPEIKPYFAAAPTAIKLLFNAR
jgi:hypothetical protein